MTVGRLVANTERPRHHNDSGGSQTAWAGGAWLAATAETGLPVLRRCFSVDSAWRRDSVEGEFPGPSHRIKSSGSGTAAE
jgi:hypothetical protein